MRIFVLLLLLAGMVLSAYGAKRVTVDQLEQIVATASGKSDAKIAQQLANLELTERVNATRFSRMEAALPGVDSRRALVVLADLSAFLAPPAAEIPATATPDFAAQKQIVSLAVDYASKTIAQLPNFYASRDTIHFEDTPPGQHANASVIPYEPMHAVERVTDTVLYRKGEEVVDPGTGKQKPGPANQGLTTKGVFGPILGTVLIDSVHGKLAWSHWEQGASGPQAVFRFDIPKEKSHYEVQFCCIPGSTGNDVFKQYSGYHGEITVDPVSGTILRLTLQADLKQSDPLSRSDIMVEYGPVEIGAKTYICPIKSVSVTIAPPQAEEHMAVYFSGSRVDKNIWAARDSRQTRLNDVVFQQYHMFRSSARILTENDAEQAGKPEEAATVKTLVTPVPAAAETAIAPAPVASTAPAPETAFTPAPEPADPEVSVTEASGMPNTPATLGTAPHETGFTLRLTTRLVDVGVVALDKKGHPVTDLTPDDFEIYDNGRKQAVRFLQAVGTVVEKPAQATNQPGAAQDEAVYSNRHAELGTKTGTAATEGNTTILLVDANNLAWTDLNNAREQMLRFVQILPAGERVGFYVQQGRGFQVEVEGTADHPRLVSALRKWMPNAQDLAQSQETEKRNRQQFDEVLHAEDLNSVNGAPPTDMVSNMADPQLRDMGGNPGRESLAILLSAARHLAAVPGHKNLVWVASDNVLANYTDRAVGSDKGGKHIDGFALRAQEVLNEAHVSVYPLDASQLEASIPDASLQNRNVELSQSVTVSEGGGGGSHGGESAQPPGRLTAEMQDNIRPIQSVVREMAEATGGRVFRRAGDIATDLKGVVEEGRGSYLLAYTPDTPADDQFHQLTVKLPTRRGVTLRYRTSYLYSKDPATPKERFRQAVWQSLDASEIAVSAWPVAAYTGATLKLNIAINDLALKLSGDRWKDKLDIFVVHRAADGLHTRISGRTLNMGLLPATYQKYLTEGVPFEQFVEKEEGSWSIRILVVDENSGRMGSVTLPSTIFKGATIQQRSKQE
ncbi:MAG: VWA domain-containing protein [Terracidiphilus sp.]|nr:VWA domain-containing protein [Terracidiphilus sp.]